MLILIHINNKHNPNKHNTDSQNSNELDIHRALRHTKLNRISHEISETLHKSVHICE